MKKTGQPPDDLAMMEKYLRIIHRYAMYPVMKQDGLPECAAKVCQTPHTVHYHTTPPQLMVTVARYAGIVPADKAFFDAGNAAKDVGWTNTAFVLLNRYLDISELQDDDEPSIDQLDNADFVESDVPFDFEVPKEPWVAQEPAEQARQWVLSMSVDNKLEQVLTTVKCGKCTSSNWEGSIRCHSCWDEVDECVVTGFPAHRKINCKSCSMSAVKVCSLYFSKFSKKQKKRRKTGTGLSRRSVNAPGATASNPLYSMSREVVKESPITQQNGDVSLGRTYPYQKRRIFPNSYLREVSFF